MMNKYQRKTINVFISNHYQEVFHIWNVPVDEKNILPNHLIASYTYHQALNLEMPEELRTKAVCLYH